MSRTIISLDVGDKRIGVAKSALDVKISSPLATLENTSEVYDEICELAQELDAVAIVVGHPLDINYKKTEQTKKVDNFASVLESRIEVPLYFQDETLTSVKAEQELKEKGKPFEKGAVDALAATFILEDFMEQNLEVMKELTNG
ncbi:MAG: Holliday junction resolvase RuvX [bacterium]|nr:Holliday junction resolvase RuvX [bacterium]